MTAQAKINAPQTEAAGPFVLNLCASTTPMALAQPNTPELKRFSFFVSRRREEGRERFRLHMGYFATLAEAEEWLNVVRDIYPGAWAGEAPGKRLAERAAAAAATEPPVVPPELTLVEPPLPPVVPTLQAAPESTPIQSKPVAAQKASVQKAPMQKAPAQKAAPAAVQPKALPLATSNVKEVLKSLDDTGETRVMPAPIPASMSAPASKAAPAPVTPPPAAAKAAAPATTLSDSQVLKVLENRRIEDQPRGSEESGKGIEMLRPDDTATVRALKDAVSNNAPVHFAVQLQWSVQPIDLSKMPPLAIFSAYTLYTVEGSRDGRKWYGVRLGFFSDAISAKQVASYVRSEFTSVAVIPVSAQERGRATGGDTAAPASRASKVRKAPDRNKDEFKLLDDQTDDIVSPGLAAAQAQLQAKKPAAARAAALKQGKRHGGRVRANEKRSPKTLEETLEILGADSLEIDNGRGELLNDSGVRHLGMQRVVQKNSPFAKLLERLSERVKKP